MAPISGIKDWGGDISFRIVDPTRYNDVSKLLYSNFLTDEPMCKALNLIEKEGMKIKDLDDFILHGLSENLSIMAIDNKSGGLLGVCVNVEAKREDSGVPLKEELANYSSPKFKKIMTVLHGVNEKAGDVFSQMETDLIFDIKMVTTDKEQRRGGLGTDLLGRSLSLARTLGYKAVKTEATGLYSRKAFEKLGFAVNAEFLYEDFVDEETGQKIFESAVDPHRCTTLMTKRL